MHDGPQYSRVGMVSTSETASKVASVMNISVKLGLCHVVVVELHFPMNLLNCSEYYNTFNDWFCGVLWILDFDFFITGNLYGIMHVHTLDTSAQEHISCI